MYHMAFGSILITLLFVMVYTNTIYRRIFSTRTREEMEMQYNISSGRGAATSTDNLRHRVCFR